MSASAILSDKIRCGVPKRPLGFNLTAISCRNPVAGCRAVLDIFNPSSFIYANDIQALVTHRHDTSSLVSSHVSPFWKAQGPADDYSPSDPLEGWDMERGLLTLCVALASFPVPAPPAEDFSEWWTRLAPGALQF